MVNVTNFLKPYLHMDSEKHLIINHEGILEKFGTLEIYTPSVGLAFGIIAYSSTITQ
jgi:hypothetical protein